MATKTVKEIAHAWDESPRSIRKFLRAEVRADGGTIGVDTPGKGGRYAIEANRLKSMHKRFLTWKAQQAAIAAQRAQDRANEAEKDAEAESPEGDDEVEVLDEPEVLDAE